MKRQASKINSVIEQQAARHLLTLLDNPAVAEIAAIEHWINENPAHAVAFAQAETAWESSERLKALHGGLDPAEGASWRSVASPSRRRVLAAGGAAAAASVLGVSLLALNARGENYTTKVGEVRDVSLHDGSKVHLNTDTQLKVAIEPDHFRLTMVRGEAYFDVAHNPSRPFDVAVPGAMVRALGTAFNIRVRAALVELTVTQGLVGVHSSDGIIRRVPAGETAVIQPQTVAISRVDTDTIDQRLAWRDHSLVLNGETVADAVTELNRYRSKPIVIGDERVGRLRIGGRFRTDESASFLSALTEAWPVRAIASGDDGTILLVYDPSATRPDI